MIKEEVYAICFTWLEAGWHSQIWYFYKNCLIDGCIYEGKPGSELQAEAAAEFIRTFLL